MDGAPGGEAAEEAGEEGGGEDEQEEEEGDLLEVELGEIEQLGQVGVELAEQVEVVELLQQHCIEDDGGTLHVEQEQRDPVTQRHPPLSLGCRYRDGDKKGDEQIDKFVVGHQSSEVWLENAHEDPGQGNLHNNRHKEESRAVLETENVDNNLHEKDGDKHEDGVEVVEREDHSEALPGSVVIGKQGLDHGEEGDAHGTGHKKVKLDSKAVEVILLDKPIETHQQNPLDNELTKRFCDSF